MLDLKQVRTDPERVRRGLERKRVDTENLDRILELDRLWRDNLQEVEALRAQRNRVSEEIGRRKRAGDPAEEAMQEMRVVADRIKKLDARAAELESEMQERLIGLPNLPDDDVPDGDTDDDNVEIRLWGEPRSFNFDPLPHWELGERLGMLDFARAGKVTGSRFAVYAGPGARLVRTLIQFMVNSASMTGTGQLPKFAEDAFRVAETDYWLAPTAEVPVTNLYRDEILTNEQLPIRHVAYTPCFRSEAGAAGRDTRGLIRQHQFDKVELVKFVDPATSEEELTKLLADASSVLEQLELPYRVVEMCTGDLGFSAARKYDLEVWMPSYERYVEISSCSNFRDFQARRANIRFRPQAGAKPEYVHTLNGSGLAVGRTVAAIIENYQNSDGSIRIPDALQAGMGMKEIRSEA